MLDQLADEGRTDLVTVGLTPVLAAQLDDVHTLRGFHTWLGFWQARSQDLAANPDPGLRSLAGYEFQQATGALAAHERRGRCRARSVGWPTPES
jgi:1,4-alpha-glucan branching enzyme